MSIRAVLSAAKASGLSFHVSCEGETDYCGTNINAALSALNACDEMELRVIDKGEVIGWALYIPGLEADEQIADCSGWIAKYFTWRE